MNPQTATAMQPIREGIISIKQHPSGDFFQQIQKTYDAIARRAFELFESKGRWLGNEWGDWFRAESEFLHPLYLEITETSNAVAIRAEAPGFAAKEIEINIEPRRLTISGKHQTREESTKGKTIYSEQCGQELLRVVELPIEVDGTKSSATLKDGILSIEMPKATHPKKAAIQPKAS